MTAVTPEGDDLNVSVLSDIFPVIPAAETLVASTSTHACAVLSGASNDCGSSAAYTCVPDAKQMKKAKMIDTAEIREDSLALLAFPPSCCQNTPLKRAHRRAPSSPLIL